ncbi:cistern family PEP-CTERM protein [Nostocales cyanobacterium LEGE 11386]|nr:cistern family PEP-CTERM protein [Nostocales cyanobacterium LEGE 11386]
MKINSFFPATLVAAGVAIATSAVTPAHAITLTTTTLNGDPTVGNPPQQLWQADFNASDVGQSFNVNWFLPAGSANSDGDIIPVDLSATSNWTITSFSNTQIGLDIDISNTTSLGTLLSNANILSFGFGVDPNATATLSQAGQTFDLVSAGQGGQQSFPGGFRQVDVCIFSANNCAGGNVNLGLIAGASDTLSVLLTANSGNNFSQGASLAFFPLKFQTSEGSYELAGVPGNPTPVPEPITTLGFGVGVAGASLLKWKYGNKEMKKKGNSLIQSEV